MAAGFPFKAMRTVHNVMDAQLYEHANVQQIVHCVCMSMYACTRVNIWSGGHQISL